MRTLLLERACLLACCTLLVVSNVREHGGMRGVRWFAASNVNYLIGGILIANRENLPVWLSVVIANFLYSVGYVFLHRCLAEFLGRNKWLWRAQCALALFSLVICISFTLVHPDIRLRLAMIGLATGLQFAICAAVAFEGARAQVRVAAIAMGSVMTFSALLNLSRVALTLIWGTTQTYLKSDDIQTTVVMLNTVVFVSIDIAFVWMIATTLRKELQTQAMTDPLTRVLNRRALQAMMIVVLERSRRLSQPLSAVVMDLDDFKSINDSHGHGMGDLALVEVVRCLQMELRSSDLIARVGGDEFVVVLPNCISEKAQEIAERLRAALESTTVSEGEKTIQIRASFGVATSLADKATSWEILLADCDRALYAAKNAGGNLVHGG